VDTGEVLTSRYNFAGEQHFEKLTPRFQTSSAEREGGGGDHKKIKLGKNIVERHL